MPGVTAQQHPIAAHSSAINAVMKAKIAEVRSVVANVSNNDIILALHQYDNDVQRTIQALTEHGSAALDEWESSGAKSKKNKKKKPSSGVYGVAAVPSAPTTSNLKLNGVVNDLPVTAPAPVAAQPQRQRPNKVTHAQQVPLANGHHVPPVESADEPISRLSISSHSELDTAADPVMKRKAIAKEATKLSKHDAQIERVTKNFDKECHEAEARMRRAFEELRKMLSEREVQLQQQLSNVRKEGSSILSQRQRQAGELHSRSLRAPTMSDDELNNLRNDIKHFVAAHKSEEELGSTLRFTYAPDQILQQVKTFGQVNPVKSVHASVAHNVHHGIAAPVNTQHQALRYNQQPSPNSEPDSGLGSQISPGVHQQAAVKKQQQPAQVNAGGLVMKSNDMSPAELEAINQAMQMAMGMSGNVLSTIQSSNVAPRRNRGGGARGGQARGGGVGGDRGARGGRGGNRQ